MAKTRNKTSEITKSVMKLLRVVEVKQYAKYDDLKRDGWIEPAEFAAKANISVNRAAQLLRNNKNVKRQLVKRGQVRAYLYKVK